MTRRQKRNLLEIIFIAGNVLAFVFVEYVATSDFQMLVCVACVIVWASVFIFGVVRLGRNK